MPARQALVINRELGIKWEQGNNLNNLAQIARKEGDFEEAASLFAEALTLYLAVGVWQGIAVCLDNVSRMEEQRDQFARAARLLGATQMCVDSLALNYHGERRDETEFAAKLREKLAGPNSLPNLRMVSQ